MSYAEHQLHTEDSDPAARLKGFDCIELYVGNAKQAAYFYRTAFGFRPVAYAGPETGASDRMSYVLEQSKVRLVLTSPLTVASPIADFVRLHGDGIKDVCFSVDDVDAVFHTVVRKGAPPVCEPTVFEDDRGVVRKASVATFGDTIHSFVNRKGYAGAFLPGYQAIPGVWPAAATGILAIDHIAIAVEKDTLEHWADYYSEVFGFRQSMEEGIATDYSAMNSKVLQNRSTSIKTVFVEPAPGKRKSPIEEYLTHYRSSGVHHVAFLTDDIIATVGALCQRGVEFTTTPGAYYDHLESRVGHISEEMESLRRLSILVDRDEWGYLLQIFGKPVHPRPTFFYEIIQRKGARGFGSGNIKALFEAIEREQLRRGNA